MLHRSTLRLPLLLLLAACSSLSGHERTAQLTTQFEALASDLATLKQQVDASLGHLDALTHGGDALTAYSGIRGTTERIGTLTAQVRSANDSAQALGSEHFAAWSQQNAAIQDPELRDRATARQTELASLTTSTTAAIGAAMEQGKGFLLALNDLQKYLSNDLGATAIGNAADRIARMRGTGARFATGLDSVSKDAAHLADKLGA